MAAFGIGSTSRPLQGRGGSPGFRFFLYGTVSIVVMFMDQRHGWLEQARYVLQAAAYPIELAVNSPSAAWHWLQGTFETREALQAENLRLRTQQRELQLRTMRYEALAKENGELRGLRDALPPVADRWLAAEIVNLQLNSLRQRVVINRGTTNGVFKGQAVLDGKGLVGQTTHVGPWSAEIILITDPEHAVPVQIERTGLRTIAVGSGDTASLALPYLPANADIKTGDLLITSGLGGVFPAGYPVARVAEVHRDAVQPLAQVRAIPLANIDVDREVVLVWFREDHPAAPVAATTGDLAKGNAALKPQPAPPKPKPVPPAATAPPTPSPAATAPSTPSPAGSPEAGPTANSRPGAGGAPAQPRHEGASDAGADAAATPQQPRTPKPTATNGSSSAPGAHGPAGTRGSPAAPATNPAPKKATSPAQPAPTPDQAAPSDTAPTTEVGPALRSTPLEPEPAPSEAPKTGDAGSGAGATR